jgi:hypothetical protein
MRNKHATATHVELTCACHQELVAVPENLKLMPVRQFPPPHLVAYHHQDSKTIHADTTSRHMVYTFAHADTGACIGTDAHSTCRQLRFAVEMLSSVQLAACNIYVAAWLRLTPCVHLLTTTGPARSGPTSRCQSTQGLGVPKGQLP